MNSMFLKTESGRSGIHISSMHLFTSLKDQIMQRHVDYINTKARTKKDTYYYPKTFRDFLQNHGLFSYSKVYKLEPDADASGGTLVKGKVLIALAKEYGFELDE